MNLKKLESYLRVNLLGPGPRLIKKKKNLPGRVLTKVEKNSLRQRGHWDRQSLYLVSLFSISMLMLPDRPQLKCFSSLTLVYVCRLTEIHELIPTTGVVDILFLEFLKCTPLSVVVLQYPNSSIGSFQ